MDNTCQWNTDILSLSLDAYHSRLIYKSYCLNLIDPSSALVQHQLRAIHDVLSFLGVFSGHFYLE
ncbi:hypothetical protein BT93_G0135 [Corymbia citriodora subsp. variegata]|nr:hypothetical protein BT93_G0135 [Corymbia citriodora subsp. variegata]